MSNKLRCPCTTYATRKAALQALQVEDPRDVWRGIRDQVLRWYSVETMMELADQHVDAAQSLTRLWSIMNEPITAKIQELKWRANPDCWCCGGSGEYDPERIEYATTEF